MMTSKDYETRVVGRDSRTGEFVPIKETDRRPATTEKEQIKYPKK